MPVALAAFNCTCSARGAEKFTWKLYSKKMGKVARAGVPWVQSNQKARFSHGTWVIYEWKHVEYSTDIQCDDTAVEEDLCNGVGESGGRAIREEH